MFTKYNYEIHHRQSIRLPEYDYSKSGIYFVTICTQNRECLFGKIKNDKMVLSEIGKIANKCWLEIPRHFYNVILDVYVIMPNHIHGLIRINVHKNVGAQNLAPLRVQSQNKFQVKSRSLGSIIRGFKIGVTKLCHNDYAYFNWQRNYYERIIRNDNELNRIREYIKNNPFNWERDRNNIETK